MRLNVGVKRWVREVRKRWGLRGVDVVAVSPVWTVAPKIVFASLGAVSRILSFL